ncbi:MAG: hypothetical protein ACP5HS_10395 [Anaerolineae bacterium]
MTTLELDIAATVYCRGKRCGVIRKVIVGPEGKRITNLIVERETPQKPDRVVPVALTADTDDQCVHLCIRPRELSAYPEYQDEAA